MSKPTLAVALFSFLIVVPQLSAQEFPARKPGLWEIKVQTSRAGAPPMTAPHSIDAAADAKMQEMARGMPGAACSENKSSRSGDSFTSDSVCTVMGSTVTSHAVLSGDFQSDYSGKIKSTFNPPLMGKKEGETTIDARYLGACKADQKPGDVILQNGMKMNVFNMPPMPGGPGQHK